MKKLFSVLLTVFILIGWTGIGYSQGGTGIGTNYTTYRERSSAPATPPSNYDRLFFKSDGLYYINSAGTSTRLITQGLPTAIAAGTADALTADFTPDITLADKTIVAVEAKSANATTTPSFAPDGLTAHTIVKSGGSALVAGDIPAEHAMILLEYNLAHTRWELINPAVTPTAAALAANGANCNAGYAPLGVDAAGAVEGCWAAAPASGIALTALANQAAQTVNMNATDGAAAPTAVAISASQVVARLAAGNIKGASTAEMKTLLGYPTSGEYDTPNASTTGSAGSLLSPASELTLATDIITVTGGAHTVDTESDAASDDLVTINGAADGKVIFLRASHTDRTVVLKETGNILLTQGTTLTLDSTSRWAMLYYDGNLTKWVYDGICDQLSFSSLDASSFTSIVPFVVNTSTASGYTAAGTCHFESDTEILTIGDGATQIGLDFTPNVVYTFPGATSTLARTDAGQTFTGVQAFTAPTVATSIAPASNDGATLGTSSLSYSDIYLADGAVIYGQADESNTITSAAGGWTFAKPITIADVTNDNYIKITNNSGGRAPTASVYEIYPDAGAWKANQNGTEYNVQMAGACSAITPSATATLTVVATNCYTYAAVDDQDVTLTFSGAGYAGQEVTIIFATGTSSADEIITFHATLASSVGTLTLADVDDKFYVIRFISNGTHWYEVSRTAVQT